MRYHSLSYKYKKTLDSYFTLIHKRGFLESPMRSLNWVETNLFFPVLTLCSCCGRGSRSFVPAALHLHSSFMLLEVAKNEIKPLPAELVSWSSPVSGLLVQLLNDPCRMFGQTWPNQRVQEKCSGLGLCWKLAGDTWWCWWFWKSCNQSLLSF